MSNKRTLLSSAIALSTLGLSASLYTTSSVAGEFHVSAGGLFSQANTQIGVYSTDLSQEFKLDLEDDLALKDREISPYLYFAYDFNDTHTVFFDWRRLHRNATIEGISKAFVIPIDGKDYEVQVGARLNSTLNIDVARAGYAYTFFDEGNWEIDATAGLHIMRIEVGLGGELGYRANDTGNVIPVDRSVFETVTAPLPNFGLIGAYDINEDWSLVSHAQFFYIKYQAIRGLLIDTALGVQFSFTDNLDVIGSYSYYEVGLDYGDDTGDLSVNFQFYGPMIAMNYRF